MRERRTKRIILVVLFGPVLTMAFLAGLACDSDDDDETGIIPTAIAQVVTLTPPTSTGGGGGDAPATAVPIETPFATPSASPADWREHTVPASGVDETLSFRYPPHWYIEQSVSTVILFSYDQSKLDHWPSDGNFIKVDITFCELSSPGCNPLESGSPVVVDGNAGFEARFSYSEDSAGDLGSSRVIQFKRGDFAYSIAAFFGNNVAADDRTFEQIAGSMEFKR